jgi:hypothetical protein
MSQSAISSFGTLVKIGDGAGSFTTIAELLDIDIGISMNTEDASSHDQSAAWVERIATLGDGGEVTFDVNYLPGNSTHNATNGLLADLTNRVHRDFEIVFPDGSSTTWTITALVTGFGPNAPVQGTLTSSITLTISGEPTLN